MGPREDSAFEGMTIANMYEGAAKTGAVIGGYGKAEFTAIETGS